MFLCLNYCFICVEMTRLGELLHQCCLSKMASLILIANAITRTSLLATPKWGPSLVGQSVMVACEETVGLSNFFMNNITKKNLDRPFVDELGTSTGPWPRYLVMTSTDRGKTLSKLSHFCNSQGCCWG